MINLREIVLENIENGTIEKGNPALGFRKIKKDYDLPHSLKYMKKLYYKIINQPARADYDNPTSTVGWRELVNHAKSRQEISGGINKNSFSERVIDLSHIKHPILVVPFGDIHIGAKGVDYELFQMMTEEFLKYPEIYFTLQGDTIELAIVKRNLKEIIDGALLTPEMQYHFLETWLDEIKHKVLWASWGNHDQEREERSIGFSVSSRILGVNKNIPIHNGIGHVDLKLGKETYKFASSHKFNGMSYLNRTHGQQRYMRFEGLDREIAISGHTHQPAISWYYDGQTERLALNNGTLQVNSGYAKRYFSIFTMPTYPCIEIYPDTHAFNMFPSIRHWAVAKGKNIPELNN